MPDALVVLFYVWLAVSVGALAYRTLSRRRRRSPVVTSTSSPGVPAAPPTEWPAPPPTTASPSPSPADPVSATAAPAAPPPTPTPTPTPPDGAAGGARAASLMEALAGITLPCDLVPLTTVEGRVLGARELFLITSGHSAFEVGRAMGEAVVALGYTLTPMANNDLVASRGQDRIAITILDRPDALLTGKHQEFPTAKPGDVVVGLRL